MKKIIVVALIFTLSLAGFSQTSKTQNELQLSVGKLYSPYRYFKHYNAYENIGLAYSRQLSEHFGVQIQQSYGRMFDKNTNSRAFVLPSIVSVYYKLFFNETLSLKVLAGTGVEQIHIHCLYDFYPYDRHVYGVPVHLQTGVFYKLNDTFSLSLNLVSNYSYLIRNKEQIFNDKYYHKTWFFSTDIGLF